MSVLLSTTYFGPVEFFAHFINQTEVYIEQHENFTKQTYRNRCVILGANGPQNLNVPVQKVSGKQNIKDLKIAYAEDWVGLHLKSIQSAYGNAPFYENIFPDVNKLLLQKPAFLFDLNLQSMELVKNWLNLEAHIKATQAFSLPQENNDYRFSISPKIKSKAVFQPYFQVFQKSFTANLSILDLVFNQGAVSWEILKNTQKE